jgi:cell wall-active antibiotic response 4TMS protein YvqF
MRIRRGLLFWGLFLIPLGALPLLVRAGVFAPETFAEAWRLWPIVLIVIGAMIVVGRTRAAVVGTAVGALVLGTAAGGAIAGGNLWFGGIIQCGSDRTLTEHAEGSGTFDGASSVLLDLHCGEVEVSTGGGGGGWAWEATFNGAPPVAVATADRLSLRSADGQPERRNEWKVTLPADLVTEIDLRGNAGTSTLDLDGAALERLTADINAGDLLIDAGSATIDRLSATMNAGRTRIVLGEGGSVSGSLSVNAGAIDLCVPREAELRITANDQITFGHNLGSRGLSRSGNTWTRAGSSGQVIDLSVEGNAASLTLDPDGGCR